MARGEHGGMLLVVKHDEAPDPVDVCLFSSPAVVSNTDRQTDLLHLPRRSTFLESHAGSVANGVPAQQWQQ
jgi:hypothetical protein